MAFDGSTLSEYIIGTEFTPSVPAVSVTIPAAILSNLLDNMSAATLRLAKKRSMLQKRAGVGLSPSSLSPSILKQMGTKQISDAYASIIDASQ